MRVLWMGLLIWRCRSLSSALRALPVVLGRLLLLLLLLLEREWEVPPLPLRWWDSIGSGHREWHHHPG